MLEDMAVLPGVASVFTNAASSDLGRITLVAFTQAWTAYAEGKTSASLLARPLV